MPEFMAIFAFLMLTNIKMKKILLVLLAIFILTGCKKEDKKLITGTITFDFTPGAGDVYVFFDSDLDLANGFIVKITATSSGSFTSFDYSFNTEGIPAGSYYIRGGYDQESVDNMDPENPAVWEGRGWYGSVTGTAPSSPNVSKLNGRYDFKIFQVAK
jgi:hypothetical protein